MSSELEAGKAHSLDSSNAPDEGLNLSEPIENALGPAPSMIVQSEAKWVSMPLGEVVSLKTGKLDSNAAEQNGRFPFFTCSPQTLAINSYAFDTEAVILAGNNANGIFCCKYYSGKFNAYQRTYVIEPLDNRNTSCKFIYFYISHIVNHLQELSVGSATKFLTKTILTALPVKLPPRHVQEQIAFLLSALDDHIALLRETNATLEAMAQALFKSWFVDFDPVHANAGTQTATLPAELQALFPSTFTDTPQGPVPEGWRVGTLSELAEFQNGYAFKSKDWTDSGHPVVKIGDVKPGIIDFSGCSYVAPETVWGLERFRLNRGDLLVGMTGYVGETGLVPSVEPAGYVNQRVGRFSTQNGLHDCGFVYCLVRNPEFKAYAEAQSHGSAQANVSGTALQAYPCIIPTDGVMDLLNQNVYPLLESILSNHERAQTLATLRDTLLPRLISGQLRLPDDEAALAEAGA